MHANYESLRGKDSQKDAYSQRVGKVKDRISLKSLSFPFVQCPPRKALALVLGWRFAEQGLQGWRSEWRAD